MVNGITARKEDQAIPALQYLAKQVKDAETGTIIYKIFTPDLTMISLPAQANGEVIFLEVYQDQPAYNLHIAGKAFQNFVQNYGDLFLSDFNGKLYFKLEMLNEEAGFIREAAIC